MEVLPVLLLIALIVIVLNQNSKLSNHLQRLEAEIKLLRNQFLKQAVDKSEEPKPVVQEQPKPVEEIKPYKSIFEVAANPVPIIPLPVAEVEPEKIQDEIGKPPEPEVAKIITTVEVNNPVVTPAKVIYKQPQPSFFERHPDMEKFIGENLVSKIGIAILVLAIGFFVKYAIDQNWIGPVGRVAIGILCGGILVAIAHKLRNSYKSFSSVLAGGGLAVFYFTITLGYHQFHLFSQTAAFIIMIVITAFAAALSLLYNKQELAIIALIGGFAAPFLVSDGSGNYKTLFIYLIVLNSGLLVIAYNKAWRLLNLLNFIFTVLIFGSWLYQLNYNEPPVTFTNGFLFAVIFYLLFFTINIAHNIKEKKKFIASDFGILLANTCLFFGAGIYCLIKMGAPEMKGLFSASMGIFNLAASYFLFRKQKVDSNILYLLIGITLTFISITAPLQLHGNYITLFWASEAVLMYWLFTKSKISIIQYAAALVWVLMLISLLMDWVKLYTNYSYVLAIIVNKGFITTIFAAVATYLLFILRNKESENSDTPSPAIIPGKTVFRISAIVLLFAAGALEINYQFNYYYPNANFSMLYLLLYTVTFISILTAVTQKVKHLQLHWQIIAAMLSVCIVFYFMSMPQTFGIQAGILQANKNMGHFVAHWIIALLVGTVLFRLIQLVRNNKTSLGNNFDFITWLLCAVTVIYLSVEIHLLSNHIFYAADNSLANIQRVYIKTGLPILWGLCSFAFMWLGMRNKYKTLRIVSLSLFTVTLAKLFIFDIRNIPAGGKIAAFFCLGVLLLVVSFMYQRLKKIIIDDEKKVD
jgi:uncharacterized membrane protein